MGRVSDPVDRANNEATMTDEERQAEEKRGFKVEDRRRFTADGQARDAAEAPSATAEPRRPSVDAAAPQPAPPMPEINFSTFVISLCTQALILLGERAGREATPQVDLVAAKQLIDILGMLREKTRGNLEADETSLLDGMLYDLRLRYVERAKPTAGA